MLQIREMREADRAQVVAMMQDFYTSPAVFTDGSIEIYQADVDACVGESPYAEGFMLEWSEEGEAVPEVAGYCMVAKSFSTEFGKPCIWVEDIYLLEQFRGKGIAGELFKFLEKRFPEAILRLEVEHDNPRAIRAYEKSGFGTLPYLEMVKGASLN